MNVKNILALANVIDASTADITLDAGKGGFVHFVREHIVRTHDEIDMPSPVDWLGLGYEQAEQLFEMKPYCPHCSEEQSEQAEAGLRLVFNQYPAPLRRAILRDLLRYLANYGWVDWKTAKHMNDVEVAA